MGSQLFDRLHELRAKIRRLIWVYGASLLVAVLLGSLLVAGLLDWCFHFDDGGVRLVLDLLIVGASGTVGWRWLVRPLMTSLSDLDLALRVERRYPGLKDSLASTVQFLLDGQQSEVGSPAMQREVIRRTLDQLNGVTIDGVLETKSVRKVGMISAVTCLVVLTVAGLNQARATTALKRLAFPFSPIQWPRKFELRFVTEDLKPLVSPEAPHLTVVQGATLDVYVENTRGPLPKDLTFEALRADGKRASERMRQTSLWDIKGRSREIGGASLLVSKGPIVIRAKGGDGETEQVQIEVVPPPRMDSLKLTVTPPAYTRLPVRELPENVGNVEGYVGTKVELRGTSNKELGTAIAQRKDAEGTSLVVSTDGRGVTGGFVLARPGSSSWWLAMKDRQGFENPDTQRFDLRVLPDLAPDVRLDEPLQDLTVTPDAQVRFKVTSKDDLAIQQMLLVYETSGSTDSNAATRPTRIELLSGDERPQQQTVEYVLDLKPLKLQVGQKVVVHGEATDYCDIGEVHLGKSGTRTLTVISEDEKRSELADRQAALVLELERVQKLELTARGHIKELQLQMEQAGSLRTADLDLLKRVELDQRQITTRIGAEQEGLEAQTQALRDERSRNGIDDPQAAQLLENLAGELEFVRREALPTIEQDLNQTLKLNSGETSPKSPPKGSEAEKRRERTQQALERTAQKQDLVLNTFSKTLQRLAAWRDDRNLSGDLRELAEDQQKLVTDTKQLGQQTISKSTAELSPQQKAELNKLAERQQQLAQRVDEFQQALTAPPKSETESPSAEQQLTRSSLQKQIEQQNVNSLMRQAASELTRNNIAQAVKKQDELIETLRKLQELVDESETTDQETLVKQLAETQSELANLRAEQEELMGKLEAAQKLPASDREEALAQLKKKQEQLRQRTDEVLRRLQRMQSNKASRAASRASEHMEQAEESLAKNDPEQAQSEIQETLDDLEQAERELNRDKKRAELELAQEVMERMADELKSLRDRQQGAIEETQRIKAEFDASGKWSRGLLKSVRSLAQTQSQLKEEVLNKAKDVKAIEILSLALSGAGRAMEAAAQKLDQEQPQLNSELQQAQVRAKQRLDDLLTALAEQTDEKASQPTGGSPQQGNDEQRAQGPPGESIPIIAQLRMIRAMQVELIERTNQIREQQPARGELSQELAAELEVIGSEQSQLADLVRELTQYFGDAE